MFGHPWHHGTHKNIAPILLHRQAYRKPTNVLLDKRRQWTCIDAITSIYKTSPCGRWHAFVKSADSAITSRWRHSVNLRRLNFSGDSSGPNPTCTTKLFKNGRKGWPEGGAAREGVRGQDQPSGAVHPRKIQLKRSLSKCKLVKNAVQLGGASAVVWSPQYSLLAF